MSNSNMWVMETLVCGGIVPDHSMHAHLDKQRVVGDDDLANNDGSRNRDQRVHDEHESLLFVGACAHDKDPRPQRHQRNQHELAVAREAVAGLATDEPQRWQLSVTR